MTTVQFEYDPEMLIEEVKKRPGIWDFDDNDYRAKNVRYKLWLEIVTELMGNDVKISKSDMRELELQLQKKWKSMRDCFQKYISKPNRTKRPYIYVKQLQFLLKNQKPLPNNDGSSESEEGRTKSVWRSKKKFKLSKESSEDDDNDNDESRTTEDTGIVIQPYGTDVSNKVGNTSNNEFMFANVDSHIDDPDKLFLLSLLPHLKSIPDEYRLNVKMDLMQVLKNANYHPGDHKIM